MHVWKASLALCLSIFFAGQAQAQTADLVAKTAFRVCADPANMPFSNKAGEGFENKLAELFAEKLELPLRYEWFPQATGFIRRTLGEKRCDVVMAYAQGHELVLNTNHYFVSSYVFVTLPDSPLADVTTLSDERLKGKRIGVIAGSPPATHMARNGLIGKAKGYHLVVDRRANSPAEKMLADILDGTVDAGVLWGPIGGNLAKSSDPALTVIPLLNEVGAPRMFYRITMGVRPGELVWKRKLNSMIRRNQKEIDEILEEFGIPLLREMGDGVIEKGAE